MENGPTSGVLNDLLKINLDRVEKYKRSASDEVDSGLRSIFYFLAEEGWKNVAELQALLKGITPENKDFEMNADGDVYGWWSEVRSNFKVSSYRNNSLHTFEFEELATLSAYALAEANLTEEKTLEILKRQRQNVRNSLDTIKSYKVAYKTRDKTPR